MPAPRRNPSVVALCLILLLVTGLGLTAILHSQVQPVGSGTLGPLVADTLCLDLTNQDVCLSRASANILELAAGDSLNLNPAGVRLSSDGDGAITFLGLGDGSDEDLTINLDDTANTAVVTASTGGTGLSLSAINLLVGNGTPAAPGLAFVTAPGVGFSRLSTSRMGISGTLTLQTSNSLGWSDADGNFVTVDVQLGRDSASALQVGSDNEGVTNQIFKGPDRITSDGVGGNLTIAGGRNRGASAGGSLIFQTSPAAGAGVTGTLVDRVTIDSTGNVGIRTTTPTGLLSRGGANASQFYEDTQTEAHTLAAAGTSDTTITYPASSTGLSMSGRITTTITGCATVDAGVAGDTARFGTFSALTATTTLAIARVDNYTSATPVRFTCNGGGGAFTAGVVRTVIHHNQASAPTS